MSGRRVWQAKVLAEHPELRPAAEREQAAREQPRDDRADSESNHESAGHDG